MISKRCIAGHDLIYSLGSSDTVYISEGNTEVDNKLELWIHNPAYSTKKMFLNQLDLNADSNISDLEEGKVSGFLIFFSYGQGVGQLLGKDKARRINVEGPKVHDNTWYTIQDANSKYGIVWAVFPGKDVELLPGESIKVDISDMVVDSVPGLASMYIRELESSYIETIGINKKASPVIHEFVTSKLKECEHGKYVNLKWDVEGADYCTITPSDTKSYTSKGECVIYKNGVKGQVGYTLAAYVQGIDGPVVTKKVSVDWGKSYKRTPAQIQMGKVAANWDQGNNPKWHLDRVADKKKTRRYKWEVRFEKTFTHTPKVEVALKEVDANHERNLRIRVREENVRKDGFDIIAETWWDSIIYGVWVSWLAYVEEKRVEL